MPCPRHTKRSMNVKSDKENVNQQEPDQDPTPADLSVDQAAQDEVKGGTGPETYGGSFRLNHNETTAEDDDDEAEAESLNDLPVETEEQVKGGPGGLAGFSLNHNE